MNETTIQLIEELSKRLGTTVDHLWGVLVQQAPIFAVYRIIALIVIVLSVLFSFIYLKRLEINPKNKNIAEMLPLFWVIWTCFSFVIFYYAIFLSYYFMHI